MLLHHYMLSHNDTAKLRNQAALTLHLQITHPPEFMILWSISERPSYPVGSNLEIAIPLPLGLHKLFYSACRKNIDYINKPEKLYCSCSQKQWNRFLPLAQYVQNFTSFKSFLRKSKNTWLADHGRMRFDL